VGNDDSYSDKMNATLWTEWYKFTSHYTGLEKDNLPSWEYIR